MSIEQKPCPICGKVDCPRYGNIIIGGYITKDGKCVDGDRIDSTITECELKQIGEKVYLI